MDTVTLSKQNRLFWLGRYLERAYAGITATRPLFEADTDGREGDYADYCRRVGIPDTYKNTADFVRRFYFDDNDPNSALELKENFTSNLFRHLIFALEYAPSEKFYIGLGYNHKTKTDMTTASRNFLSGFSAAAGLNTQKLRVGIAFAQPHIGGTTFMVNFSTNLYEFK